MFRRIIAALLPVVLADVAGAQTPGISISDFHETSELMTELNGRRDRNGQYCALLKVFSPENKAGFEGNVMGDVTFHVNEYWLYMTAGTVLRVTADGYLPYETTVTADVHEYTITLRKAN